MNKIDNRSWRCAWCCLNGNYNLTIRKGPASHTPLCNACGTAYTRAHGRLPMSSKNLFIANEGKRDIQSTKAKSFFLFFFG